MTGILCHFWNPVELNCTTVQGLPTCLEANLFVLRLHCSSLNTPGASYNTWNSKHPKKNVCVCVRKRERESERGRTCIEWINKRQKKKKKKSGMVCLQTPESQKPYLPTIKINLYFKKTHGIKWTMLKKKKNTSRTFLLPHGAQSKCSVSIRWTLEACSVPGVIITHRPPLGGVPGAPHLQPSSRAKLPPTKIRLTLQSRAWRWVCFLWVTGYPVLWTEAGPSCLGWKGTRHFPVSRSFKQSHRCQTGPDPAFQARCLEVRRPLCGREVGHMARLARLLLCSWQVPWALLWVKNKPEE